MLKKKKALKKARRKNTSKPTAESPTDPPRFREALQFLTGQWPPDYVGPNGENLHEYADELQQWCLDCLPKIASEAADWATGISIIEAAQVLVGGAIENANIPIPDSWALIKEENQKLAQENIRLQAYLKDFCNSDPNVLLKTEWERITYGQTDVQIRLSGNHIGFRRQMPYGEKHISLPIWEALVRFRKLDDNCSPALLWAALNADEFDSIFEEPG